MGAFITSYKYTFLIGALINFIVTPFWQSIMAFSNSLIIVVSLTLVILAGMNIAERRMYKMALLIIGMITLICIWTAFAIDWSELMDLFRVTLMLVLFGFLFYVLVINILNTEEICLDMIIAVMSGFLFLGIIGGVIYELLEAIHPGSLEFAADTGKYGFYYFSFISLTSVGFGDVVPQTAIAQALTAVLGILGQFYLAFGVTVFVGKFLNQESVRN